VADRAAPSRFFPSKNPRSGAACRPSPAGLPPLLALAWTSECLVFGSSACWIQRSRLDVPVCTVRLRGLRDRHWTHPGCIRVGPSSLALGFAFRVRRAHVCLVLAASRRVSRPSFHGISLPYDASSLEQRPLPGIPCPGYATPSGFLNLLTLYSAPSPSSLVSCWWRPWASTFSGFPSAVACITFR